MKHTKQLLTLSTFAILCLTSCGQRYTHSTLHCDFNIYQADLNHNGIIEDGPVTLGTKTYKSEKNLTWAESYDQLMDIISDNTLLNDAANNMGIAPGETERAALARYEILHEAEELLMSTGTLMPLYNYSDPYLLKPSIDGLYFMNIGTKYLDQITKNGQSGIHFNLSTGTKADTLDPADNNDSSTSNTLNNCMRGLSYYVIDRENSPYSGTYGSKLEWNTKLLDGEPSKEQTEEGLPIYRFKIKENNAQWSDGSNVTADDFIYTWHRACSGYHGTWGFIFDCIKGYDDYTAYESYEQKFYKGEEVEGTKEEAYIHGIEKINDYEFTVTLTYDCSFFKELCSFTAYCPLQMKKMKGKYKDSSGSLIDIDPRGKNVDLSTWWNDASNWVTNGPFKLTNINNKQTGTFDLKKNDDNGCKSGTAEVYDTKPESVSYYLIDDDSAMFMDYQRNKYDMVDSFPTAMTDKIKTDYKDDYKVAEQIGNYYFFFNANDNALDITNDGSENEREIRRANLRNGLIRLVNRLDMVDTIVKSGATDNNGFVSTGIEETCIPDPQLDSSGKIVAKRDSNGNLESAKWHERNLDMSSYLNEKGTYKQHWFANRKAGGYWKSTEDADVTGTFKEKQEKIMNANVESAIKYIKEGIKGTNVKVEYDENEKQYKFINFPSLTITTNTGTGHEALCERIQYLFGLYGIDVTVETQEWTSFSQYVKVGNVGMGRNGWIADFSDARTYLELFTSTNSQNYAQLGKTKEKGAFIHVSQ